MKLKFECDLYFAGQASMPLKPPVANEATSAESNVVKLEKHEENPVTEDITMKRSHSPGGYNVLFCSSVY